jgi:hypothetical protein
MTDKELNQIDFWLSGQKRYKLLDCSRRGFLKLKGARLQVWMAVYTSEGDEQQSWLSLETLMSRTGRSKPTVIAARRWLVKHGWIRVLEGSAADMYENPTQGAHKVRIMCVDDPTNGVGGKETLLGEGVKKLDVKELGKETLPNVSASAFASAVAVASGIAATPSLATTWRKDSPSEEPSLREDEKQKPKQQQQPSRSSSATKWLAKYDAPMPDGFNTWSQESRTTWCLKHKHKVLPIESKPEVPAPVQVKATVAESAPKASVLSATPTPPSSAPPPARPEPVPPATETDWRLEGMKSRVQDIHKFQVYSNPTLAVPPDWETVWLEEMDNLYKLTEGKDAHLPNLFMLHDVLMLSQVKHSTKYPTPAAIAAHIPELAGEALALRTSGDFDTAVTEEYFRVVNLGKPKDEFDELIEELTGEQLEKRRAEETIANARCAAAWQKWMEEHETVCA